MKIFTKPFTQQEPIPQDAISRAIEILQSGRLHRYNTIEGETAEAALLETEYAAYQGVKYCLACASGGYAMHVALRSVGLQAGDLVLTNAYTLAPVPGAIHNAGGVPHLVEIDNNYHIDIADLREKAAASGAKFLMLSHMRGHIADMDGITAICNEFGITLIEDCAHTMGAWWRGVRSGNFGRVACFSTQTYKHINSGEGGLLTTNDPIVAAKAIVHSGSYMLYSAHDSAPDAAVFDRIKLDTPNYSGRMDNLRAGILRPQLPRLDANCERWNTRYRILDEGLRAIDGITLPVRAPYEKYVGSSIQFRVDALEKAQIPAFLAECKACGVVIKWFGADEPVAFTSRYDSWHYLGDAPTLPKTLSVLEKTCDMRVPLTFDAADCHLLPQIIGDVLHTVAQR